MAGTPQQRVPQGSQHGVTHLSFQREEAGGGDVEKVQRDPKFKASLDHPVSNKQSTVP